MTLPVPIEIKPLENFRLWLRFSDGAAGIVDLSEHAGRGVFANWLDGRSFGEARIGEVGEVVWPGGADMCPHALYLEVSGKSVEELFPTLGQLSENARD